MRKFTKFNKNWLKIAKKNWDNRDEKLLKNRCLEYFPPRIVQCLDDTTWESSQEISYPIKSAYFTGASGTGKTTELFRTVYSIQKHMILNYENGNCLSIQFINLVQQFYELRKHFNNATAQDAILQAVTSCDVLVIDDIGVEKLTDWSYQFLYQIINSRFMNLKPTIYSSNLSIPQLYEHMNDDRLSNRIVTDCKDNIIIFDNKPY